MPNNPYAADRLTRNEAGSVCHRVVLQSLQVKLQIIHELIAGRLELLEATARFQVVHQATVAIIEKATGIPAAKEDSESLCRTVIGWVYLTLSHRPEEAERVTERLERELQGNLERFGQVSLPPR